MSNVDVVVPCYNYARFLERCVGSILRQENVNVRVLIIDDASTDNTPSVSGQLATMDPRVEVRRHAQNRGHIATYNEGLLEWARADYVLLLSADDALTPGALARATRLLDGYPQVGMCYGMAIGVGEDSDIFETTSELCDDYRIIDSISFLEHCCSSGNPVPTPTALVRTELQYRVGGYRADLPHSGDLEMWMRVAAHGPVGVVRAIQACYRWHGSNMSRGYYNQLLADHREVVITLRSFAKQYGERFPDYVKCFEKMIRDLGERIFWGGSQAFDVGDIEMCDQCIQFVTEICPEVIGSSTWWRLWAKRRLGFRIWKYILPVLNSVRNIQQSTSHAGNLGKDMSELTSGRKYGWWPEEA